MEVAKIETAIRERAYWIWEEEGRPQGRERYHWERASQEVMKNAAVGEAEVPAATAKTRKSVKGRIRTALKSATSA